MINMRSFCANLALFLLAFSAFATPAYEQEIRFASEAAPPSVTTDASFMAFEKGAFRLIKKGSNNFTCLVMRSPEGRFEPACLNEQAMRSIFPTYEKHLQLRERGFTEAQAMQQLGTLYTQGDIPTAEPAALVFMMSANNRGATAAGEYYAIAPHQMYFYPKISDETFRIDNTGVRLWQGYPHMSSLIVPVDPANAKPHQH